MQLFGCADFFVFFFVFRVLLRIFERGHTRMLAMSMLSIVCQFLLSEVRVIKADCLLRFRKLELHVHVQRALRNIRTKHKKVRTLRHLHKIWSLPLT